jgi:hypothetical protein
MTAVDPCPPHPILPMTLLLERRTTTVVHDLVGRSSRLLRSLFLGRHLLHLILQRPH